MTTNYHLTPISANSKTGPIPVTTSGENTCPTACPLRDNGCFAKNFHMNMHWKKVTNGTYKSTLDLDGLTDRISKLPRHQLWRHNDAGDLPGEGNDIDRTALNDIVQANKQARAKGFTYTHKPVGWNTLQEISNATGIADANLSGFTINLSANNLEHADKLKKLGAAPVVTMIDLKAPRHGKTPGGNNYSVCPAQERDDINCANCGLCQISKRKLIIAFRAHGMAKKKTLNVINNFV